MDSAKSDIRVEGTFDRRFAGVHTAFRDNFERHGETGAAVAAMVDGRLVVDLWGGHADAAGRRPWQRDTLVNIFSVGKGVATLCAMMLVARGRLDLDAPVCRDWPELGTAGKEAITLRQLLSHQAGLPAIDAPLPDEAIFDWKAMTGALERQRPWWPPGTRHGYHVNTFGFLVGELVRRASGRRFGTFLRDEVAGRLGADLHVGLGEHDHARCAEFVWMAMDPSALTLKMGQPPSPDEARMIRNAYFNPPSFSGRGAVNTARWRSAEMPSTNGHATARGVARVYAALAAGGRLGTTGLIDRDTLAEATTEHVYGPDAVLGRTTRFGLGFQLPQPERRLGPNAGAFGHFGAGGSLGFADPEAGVAFCYLMNRMHSRWQSAPCRNLVDALYACLGTSPRPASPPAAPIRGE